MPTDPRPRAPEHLQTARLVLSAPVPADVEEIYARYASDAEVTRYHGWPRHARVEATYDFLEFSDRQWAEHGMGPYLIRHGADGRLLGGTGLALEAPGLASTGYVFARDAWGHGFATEALAAVVGVASDLEVRRLIALCHPDHRASQRVLEKNGFRRDGEHPLEFPNLAPGLVQAALVFARDPAAARGVL
jgi:RimJ/RimL family protein N-acetyltransferase